MIYKNSIGANRKVNKFKLKINMSNVVYEMLPTSFCRVFVT